MSIKILVSIFLLGGFPAESVSWASDSTKWFHPLKDYDDSVLMSLGASHESHYDDFNQTLDAILISRVPETKGHQLVRQYIVNEMKSMEWFVEEDVFTDYTPYGSKSFSNIVATYDPDACRQLVVACHYDSLYNREYTLLGAIDSAVPCAMMIHMAKLLSPSLRKSRSENANLTLQFIFFDGEEALKEWSDTDSLYGSRHLAQEWDAMEPYPSGSQCDSRGVRSYLDRIDVMVLLDLIGAANPTFYSYFLDTHQLYLQLVDAENRLNQLKMMEVPSLNSHTQYFQNQPASGYTVEDDHLPFRKRGVPILHLIPIPFPSVWHRESDNRENLHHPTINNLNKILRVFVARYLHLDVPLYL